MSINRRFLDKYDEAYQDLIRVTAPIEFEPWSEHYHEEEWRDILPCYVPGVIPGAYKISTHGRVYTNIKSPAYPNGGIMAHSINQRGYHQINLMSTDGRKIGQKIARLIMLNFRFTPYCQYLEVDHIDGNKNHNFIWNLEWVDPKENTRRAILNGQRSAYFYYANCREISIEEAIEIYVEATTLGHNYFYKICNKHMVSPIFVKDLMEGTIYPEVRAMFMNEELRASDFQIDLDARY